MNRGIAIGGSLAGTKIESMDKFYQVAVEDPLESNILYLANMESPLENFQIDTYRFVEKFYWRNDDHVSIWLHTSFPDTGTGPDVIAILHHVLETYAKLPDRRRVRETMVPNDLVQRLWPTVSQHYPMPVIRGILEIFQQAIDLEFENEDLRYELAKARSELNG